MVVWWLKWWYVNSMFFLTFGTASLTAVPAFFPYDRKQHSLGDRRRTPERNHCHNVGCIRRQFYFDRIMLFPVGFIETRDDCGAFPSSHPRRVSRKRYSLLFSHFIWIILSQVYRRDWGISYSNRVRTRRAQQLIIFLIAVLTWLHLVWLSACIWAKKISQCLSKL